MHLETFAPIPEGVGIEVNLEFRRYFLPNLVRDFRDRPQYIRMQKLGCGIHRLRINLLTPPGSPMAGYRPRCSQIVLFLEGNVGRMALAWFRLHEEIRRAGQHTVTLGGLMFDILHLRVSRICLAISSDTGQ
jgi:hypothetical protein